MSKRDLGKLMKEIGAPSFNPLPPDQSEWQADPSLPPLFRMWSFIFHHTMTWGHDSPYAVDSAGHDLYIEDIAKELGMDLSQAYRTWAAGETRGIWRSGTKAEGKRRLYFCGRVKPFEATETGEQKENEIVCTDNLPTYILNKIKDWPVEKQADFGVGWKRRIAVRAAVLREVVAGARDILDDDDTAYLSEWQLEIRRQEHRPRGAPPRGEGGSSEDPWVKEQAARENRLEDLRPQLSLFVRTVADFVQTQDLGPYKTGDSSAQTAPTLLRLEKGNKRIEERAGANLEASSRRPEAPHSDDGKKQNQQYTPPPSQPLTAEEKQAENLVFTQFAQMQEAFPHTNFSSEKISSSERNDQLLVYRILHAVGAANVEPFLSLCWRRMKGTDKNALGKLPARSRAPGTDAGPRSFGLILTWARKYGDALAEAARASAEEQVRIRALEIEICRQGLSDPRETEACKATYRELLRSYSEQARGAEGND